MQHLENLTPIELQKINGGGKISDLWNKYVMEPLERIWDNVWPPRRLN